MMDRPEKQPRDAARKVAAAAIECLLVCAVLLGCARADAPPPPRSDAEKRAAVEALYADSKASFPEVPDISVDELIAMREQGPVALVDLRKPKERAVSIIPGSISKAEFEEDLEGFRGRTIVVYCTIGHRSGLYVKSLLKKNVRALNLRGSILAWAHAGQPVETPQGQPTRQIHVYDQEWDLLPQGYEALW